jgi:hypothetical protein
MIVEYHWASDTGAHGMLTPETLEAQGWERFSMSTRYADTWLMRRVP